MSRKLVDSTLSSLTPDIAMNAELKFLGRLRLWPKNTYLLFETFKDNLFAQNYIRG